MNSEELEKSRVILFEQYNNCTVDHLQKYLLNIINELDTLIRHAKYLEKNKG